MLLARAAGRNTDLLRPEDNIANISCDSMFAGDAAEASSPMAQEAEQEAEADAETEAPIQPQEADEQAEEAAVPEKFDAARSQLKTQLDMSMLRTTTSRQSAEAARSVLRSMITEEGEAQPQDGAQEAAPEADEVRASAPVGLPGVTNNSPPTTTSNICAY